ncbi:HrcA family transcriptional regulator [Campylobacter geochelonis]|uniref:Heat-inducible transcription repressor n=1 Tax=Campylobacter geochelonis TaxID=1780362 RepID=A0A128EN84_9BACT|nr:HrcA family transcriptional regulator [Campylobacter geochelonis]QKF71060.1 heat-inducible transcription repressor [Campylobacter geochelonis]CZE47230.1 heat-inducible transcription repressor [Campylobacter geochelonis]CZE47702.1 heat-inducible transcription repressor [Campylobacter geochelonis]CZE50124.1 heat-inducible transcription repressor [Campylobacter geochelonis]
MKINKRDLILDYIIEAYLNENSPIGSSELGDRMDGLMPASTIRVYFKKLSDEGAIKQIHISSGRIPTIATMNEYWRNKLDFKDKISISSEETLAKIARKFKIYCMIFTSEDEVLKEIINHNDKFIILCFDNEELVIKFNSKIFKFLSNLVGIELRNLERISMQVGLSELRAKIKELKNSKIQFLANEIIAYQIYNDERFKILLDPSITTKFDKNIVYAPLFEPGFMGIKRNITYKKSEATMFCAGSVYEDYEKFFNTIMEAA